MTTGQAAPASSLGAFRPKIWWVVAGVAALALVYLIVGRVESTVSHWPPTIREAVAPSHCAQFIALAKAAYGDNWRVRLDPRDATCDGEVSAEWERQHLPRKAPVYESTSATAPAPQPATVEATQAPAAATYCLNVISLAKAKYGAEWQTKLEGAEARACGAEIGPSP